MFPLNSTIRARQDIADTFAQYDLEANIGKLVGSRVLPWRSVELAHGTYPVIPVKQLMKSPVSTIGTAVGFAAQRAPRTAYLRTDLGFDRANYHTEEHGLEGVVDENEAAHYSSHLQHEAMTALHIRHQLLTQHELRIASQCFDTSRFVAGANPTLGSSFTAGQIGATPGSAVKWTDHTNAVPIDDIFQAKSKVFNRCGYYPDTMVISEETERHLRRSIQIKQEVIAQGAGSTATQGDLTLQVIANVLHLSEIIVGAGVVDANNPNDVAFQPTHCWGGHALVFKKCRSGDIREICLGHSLHWAIDQSMPNGYVEDYEEPQTRSQIMRIRHQTAELFKYDATAELITSVL